MAYEVSVQFVLVLGVLYLYAEYALQGSALSTVGVTAAH